MQLKESTFKYLDSFGELHDIAFIYKEYNSVMELLFDRCIEEWGDCKGRAWCATCHISIQTSVPIDSEEEERLSQLSNRSPHSRLACQIPLDRLLETQHIQYLGDD